MFKLASLLALAGFASLTSALPTELAALTAPYGPDVTVTEYPNGLPADLRASLIAREASEGASGIEKRANAGVFLCTDSHFNGLCVHIVQPEFQCINLSGDLNDKVSSLGPDSPKYCLFYMNFNCNDSEGHFGTFAPGYTDLSVDMGGWANDKISSYICHPN